MGSKSNFLRFSKACLCLILSALAVSAFSPVLAQKLPEPIISVSPDIYYPLDEVLYLEGRAVPNTRVEIRLQKQGYKPRNFTAKVDSHGEWVLAEKVPLEGGEWEVRVRTIESATSTSEWSNPRVFKVIVSGITLGGVNIKFAMLSLLLIGFIILGAAAVMYLNWHVKRLRAALVSKEVREAGETVREGIAEIRRDLLAELRLLGQEGRPLNHEELARKEHILNELDKLENQMQKEIRDIEERI